MLFDVSGTIVLYNPVFSEVKDCVDSFFLQGGKNIVLIDSCSPNQNLVKALQKEYKENKNVHFVLMDKNYGFGTGHNRGFEFLERNGILSEFYAILNPDLILQQDCLKNAIEFFKTEQGAEVSLLSPQLLSQDLEVTYLNKNHPNVFDMFLRRFLPSCIKNMKYFKKRYDKYIRMDFGYDKICEVPFASGAFYILKSEIFKKLRGFDERFFLYMEDADFSHRASEFGKVLYNPNVRAIHIWRRESAKSFKMTIVMVKSMVQYFSKHGWKFF